MEANHNYRLVLVLVLVKKHRRDGGWIHPSAAHITQSPDATIAATVSLVTSPTIKEAPIVADSHFGCTHCPIPDATIAASVSDVTSCTTAHLI